MIKPQKLFFFILRTAFFSLFVVASSSSFSHDAVPHYQSESVLLSERTLELTLEQAVYLGIRQNRSIRSANLGRVADKFSLKVIRNQYDPQVSLSGRVNHMKNQDDASQNASVTPETVWQTKYGTELSLSWVNQFNDSEQVGYSHNDGISLNISQPLLKGAGYTIASAPIDIAELNEEMNKLGLKSLVSDVVVNIVLTYRDMLQAQEQVKIAKGALERSRQLLDVNRELIKTGRMAEFDSLQTEANLANQELAIVQAEDQLKNTRMDLLNLLALDLDTNITLTTSLEAQETSIGLAEALKIARANQPAYLNAMLAKQIAERNLLVAENQVLPDISLVGGYSQVRNHDSNESDRSWESYVGVQLDMPIGPNLSNRQSEVDARIALEQQELQILDVKQALQKDVTRSIQNLTALWSQFKIAGRALELTRRALAVEREKLQAGRSSNFQVLSFEEDLRNAESARLNALLAYLNAQTTLNQIIGTTLQSWGISVDE